MPMSDTFPMLVIKHVALLKYDTPSSVKSEQFSLSQKPHEELVRMISRGGSISEYCYYIVSPHLGIGLYLTKQRLPVLVRNQSKTSVHDYQVIGTPYGGLWQLSGVG